MRSDGKHEKAKTEGQHEAKQKRGNAREEEIEKKKTFIVGEERGRK